ncbi:5-formyltetrahydrofolate cyclo-ligase [bacterium]|nr:5-formyltetrahydrofolate cyclo-ligase [bacterium]
MKKEELRKEILAKRLSLSEGEVRESSQRIQTRLIKNSLWQDVENLALYSPVKNEVDTTLLFIRALEEGKNVYFPRVEQGLRFYEVNDPGDLQKGAWGILEPKDTCEEIEELADIDLLVVPGVVFDKKGYRIGYGKGFYDELLKKQALPTVALAYSFQVVEEIAKDEWDQKVQMVIAENDIYKA